MMQNSRKEVNAVMKQEAAYFGDIVILPFLDRYELVVLKTIAICEYGVKFIFHFFLILGSLSTLLHGRDTRPD